MMSKLWKRRIKCFTSPSPLVFTIPELLWGWNVKSASISIFNLYSDANQPPSIIPTTWKYAQTKRFHARIWICKKNQLCPLIVFLVSVNCKLFRECCIGEARKGSSDSFGCVVILIKSPVSTLRRGNETTFKWLHN